MRRFSGTGVLAIAVLVVAGTHARAAGPRDGEQDAINRAIDRGVTALRNLQGPDGTWPYPYIGATALNALALLECGVEPSDKAIQRAANAVRQAAFTLDHTYSISLSILFLDRLGDPGDVPLIESLTVRLLAGQTATGGWTYTCPTSMLTDAEVRRLKTAMQEHTLVGRRGLPTGTRRTVRDLPKEVRQQLIQIQARGGIQDSLSDNSNTQFAVLALWVGRRQGLPVEIALKRVESRFRLTQNADGGWGYWPPPATGMRGPSQLTTATMTCSGVLGLAVADGSTIETVKEKGGRAPAQRGGGPALNLNKDVNLRAGLKTLATAVGTPAGEGGNVQQVGGKAFYFFWSLERVAVALGLDTIGEKDWYAWGAEILVANQKPSGSWEGAYADCGADTAFALLFLKRANLARDLTAYVKGLQDVTARELRAGGVGGAGLTGTKEALKPPFEAEKTGDNPNTTTDRTTVKDRTGESPSTPKSGPSAPSDSESARLSDELVQASGDNRAVVLDRLRAGKGVVYTEALAAAIPQLDGATKDKAREVLAERLTRMTAETLGRYLKDDDPEIRRAAALASAMKGTKVHIPTLIWMLSDRNKEAALAAHAALKELSGEDFGPAAGADSAEREKAIAAWKAWLKKQSGG